VAKPKASSPVELSDIDVNRSLLRTGGPNGQATKTSRADGVQTGTLQLIHRPTKIAVTGTVPEGHYTRKHTTAAMNALQAELMSDLARRVCERNRTMRRRPLT
jgi:hypothetical protein